jgi:alpha-tubulin suppressor-like RCC1 family protein
MPSSRRTVVLVSFLLAVLSVMVFAGSARAQAAPGQFVLRPTERQLALNALADGYQTKQARQKAEAIVFALWNNLPIRQEYPGGGSKEIQAVVNGIPLYYRTFNLNSARTSGVPLCWPGGPLGLNLNGKGTSIGIWDESAVRGTHRELAGRVTQRDVPLFLSDHATHVSGTMIASGILSSATGMSYEATINAYDFNDDWAEMAQAAAQGLKLSNHSYGLVCGWDGFSWTGDPSISDVEDYYFGYYSDWAQNYDSIAFNEPGYLIVCSAGNDRNDGPNPTIPGWPPRDGGATGFDCLPGSAGVSKNTLTVGAVKAIQGGYTGPASVEMSSFSSWGPCDDGRIKPDVVADGVNVFSCIATGDADYTSMDGTSMASPGVTGAVNLIRKHYQNVRLADPSAAMLKALVIHSAREAGPNPGPDYMFGWGLMSASEAVQVVSQASTGRAVVTEGTLEANGIYTMTVLTTGSEPLKATLVWTDPPGTPPSPSLDPPTKVLVNNLELQIADTEAMTNYLPWVLDAATPANPPRRAVNNSDNVEQVVVDPAATKTYTISVYHSGALTGGSQNFALVVTGVSPRLWTLNVNTDAGRPVEISGTHPGTTPYAADVAEGALVQIYAPETVAAPIVTDPPLYFRRWVDSTGLNLGSVPKLGIILERARSVTAEYGTVPTGYSLLTVQSEPTAAEITGTYPDTTPYTTEASERDLTTLRAPMVHAGQIFSRWKTPDGVNLSDQITYQFLLSGAQTVIAEYAPSSFATVRLTIESSGVADVPIGGTVSGETIFYSDIPVNETVTLIAPPEFGGMYFRRWKTNVGDVTLSPNNVYTLAVPSYTLTEYQDQDDATVVAEYDSNPPGMAVYTWGFNDWGQLGTDYTYNRNFPVQPLGLGSCVEVASGLYHTLALDTNNRVYSWGRNTRGQLGLGTTDERFLTPELVEDLLGVVSIAAGARHSLALRVDGSVWTWGSSSAGQIGDGEMVNRLAPTEVEGVSDAIQVAGGAYHSLALLQNGTVWAWGSNADGQLGDGTFHASLTPVQTNELNGIVKIAAGANHNLALTHDGHVWSWGDNAWGQLGINSLVTQPTPAAVRITSLVDTDVVIVDIAAGEAHSLALADDGTVYGWGANWWGALGDSTDLTRKRPMPAIPVSGKTPVALAAGAYHSITRMSDGTAYAWGWNRHGEIGDGTYTDRHTARRVLTLTDVSAVACGGYHTVAIADTGVPPLPPTNAKWTILIYMDSDNNLEQYAVNDFAELALIGSDLNRNVVVMLDGYNGVSLPGNWSDARRGRVLVNDVPDTNWGESLGEVNMGDPQTLTDFIVWGVEEYPAENVALILWDHGDGWRVQPDAEGAGVAAQGKLAPQWIADDITSGDRLTLKELESALEDAVANWTHDNDYVDIIGMDACLMGMLEVAAAVESYASYMVTSEDEIQPEGWPYTAIMEWLEENPTVNAKSFAIQMVNEFGNYYAISGKNATLSAIDLLQAGDVEDAIDELAQSLMGNWQDDTAAVAASAQTVIDETIGVNQAVIINSASLSYSGANGVSIYLPMNGRHPDYNETNVLLAEGEWDDFLDAFEADMGGSWVEQAALDAQRFPTDTDSATDTDSVDLVDFCQKLVAAAQPVAALGAGAASASPPAAPVITSNAVAEIPPFIPDAVPVIAFDADLVTASVADAIVDNRDASNDKRFTRVRGLWSVSNRINGHFREDYAYAPSEEGVETVRARFLCTNLPEGEYEVYAWWPADGDRAMNVPYEIHHAGGVTTVRVDQTRNGGKWNLLGVFNFSAGGHIVEVHNGGSQPGAYVSADAVRFSQVK